jgi:hypothetical protein
MLGHIIFMNLGLYKSFCVTDFTYNLIAIIMVQYSYTKNKCTVEQFLMFKYLLLLCMILSSLGWFTIGVTNRCLYYFSFLSIVFLPMVLYNKRICTSYIFFIVLMSFSLAFYLHTAIYRNYSYFPYTSQILGIC